MYHNCQANGLFQFTPLREGRLHQAASRTAHKLFQFTPLREGRRTHRLTLTTGKDISIHAPPRGATAQRATQFLPAVLFQFTPLREGRHRLGVFLGSHDNFNSRPSARGDQADQRRKPVQAISIHAPPRGATQLSRCIWLQPRYFNSRPSARGDIVGITPHCPALISIHAPPRGATSSSMSIIARWWNFNSRPSARGDAAGTHSRLNHGLFQFTPLREGRQGERLEKGIFELISIHAPPRGATAKDMQFLQIFCSTLTNQHGLTIVPRNLSRLFW